MGSGSNLGSVSEVNVLKPREMERDFLGLTSREPLSVVKEEIGRDACGDSGSSLAFVSDDSPYILFFG